MAPVCCRMAPISTPKAISRPTSAMMSPNPVVMASIVSSYAEPDRESEVGGSDDQRDDRIELEPHNHHDHRDDRDRRVDDYRGM